MAPPRSEPVIGGTLPVAASWVSALVLGAAVYFALRVLLSSPGNLLALLVLALMGLSVTRLVKRSGAGSLAARLSIAAALLAALLAFALRA